METDPMDTDKPTGILLIEDFDNMQDSKTEFENWMETWIQTVLPQNAQGVRMYIREVHRLFPPEAFLKTLFKSSKLSDWDKKIYSQRLWIDLRGLLADESQLTEKECLKDVSWQIHRKVCQWAYSDKENIHNIPYIHTLLGLDANHIMSLSAKQLFQMIEYPSQIDKHQQEACVGRLYKLLNPLMQPNLTRLDERLIGIDFQVGEQKLKHSFDFRRLINRIIDLFNWFGPLQSQYMAPYFPVIQSSGTGKTKLLHEVNQNLAQKSNEYQSFFLLCVESGNQTNASSIYTNNGLFPVSYDCSTHHRDQLTGRLNELLNRAQQCEKVVFIFDEAQHLLRNDGFAFRCIRWWLRMRRPLKKVVAVFTGTTSGLANYYREPPDSTTSRDSKGTYVSSGTRMFEPFYDFCTTGIFAPRRPKHTETNYRRAIAYGRPLFALMEQGGFMTERAESIILRRITLSVHDWFQDDHACLSVLGTRIQMGQTSIEIASRLVKLGYATLTYYSCAARIAHIAFLPDAVCARLAMCLMDEQWTTSGFSGKPKREWSKKMLALFSSGLCHPHKGNLGEVVSALYLLFCGDLLRARRCSDYRMFTISLDLYIHTVMNPQQSFNSDSSNPSSHLLASLTFIQVVRNHLRYSFEEMFSHDHLEWLYHAGLACYTYSLCHKIDLYAPVAINVDNKVSYVPLIISVKCRTGFSQAEVENEFNAMIGILKKGPLQGGVCMLILIGLDNISNHQSRRWRINGTSRLADILCVQVVVSPNDEFGLSDVVTQTTLEGSAKSEIYSSHGILHSNASTVGQRLPLRRNAKDNVVKYYSKMRDAFQSIVDEQSASFFEAQPDRKKIKKEINMDTSKSKI